METYNIYQETDLWKKHFQGGIKINAVEREIRKKKSFAEFQDDTETLVTFSYAVATELSDKLKPTQLRRFYTYVKKLEYKAASLKSSAPLGPEVKAGLAFLPPKLAGAASRKEGVDPLFRVISACVSNERINSKEDLEYFVQFFEAILDYHQVLSKEKSNEED